MASWAAAIDAAVATYSTPLVRVALQLELHAAWLLHLNLDLSVLFVKKSLRTRTHSPTLRIHLQTQFRHQSEHQHQSEPRHQLQFDLYQPLPRFLHRSHHHRLALSSTRTQRLRVSPGQ